MLLEIINEFIKQKSISPVEWELIVTMTPLMIRGSLSSALSSTFGSSNVIKNIDLFRLPDVKDEPLDGDSYNISVGLLEDDRAAIIGSLKGARKDAQEIAAQYVEVTKKRLRVLAMPKSELFREALSSPDITNTGVCGETANLLARIIGVDSSDDGDMRALIGALKEENFPPIHLVVSIGKSHRFIVEKNGDNVTLLQSWIGRFSLATWLAKGEKVWKLNEFVQALELALPAKKDNQINNSYNRLFNVPGVERTPSPHIASEVSVDIYFTPDDDKIVRDNLSKIYEEAQQRWND